MCNFAQKNMPHSPQIRKKLAKKQRAMAVLAKAIAKLMIKLRLHRSDFLLQLDKYLVQEAKNQDPNASNVTLSIRTGINRRYISKYLHDEVPIPKPDKLSVILEDVKWTAEKYYQSNVIPIKGPVKTFQSICEMRASGTLTYNSILEELVNQGELLATKDKVKIISTENKTLTDESNFAQWSSCQISSLVNSLTHDYDLQDNKINQGSMTSVHSTKINPEKFKELSNKFQTKAILCIADISQVLSENEESINEGTYPEFGYSFIECVNDHFEEVDEV